MQEDNKVIKSGGHCYDGCGWTSCSFWDYNKKTEESRCTMFNAKKFQSESLNICNKIYGDFYSGRP